MVIRIEIKFCETDSLYTGNEAWDDYRSPVSRKKLKC